MLLHAIRWGTDGRAKTGEYLSLSPEKGIRMTIPTDGQPTYPPAWYPDTNAPGTERWYDGSQWTEHVRPAAGSSASQAVDTSGVASAERRGPVPVRPRRPWYSRKSVIIPAAAVAGLVLLGSVANAVSGGNKQNSVALSGPISSTASKAPTGASSSKPSEAAKVMVTVPNVVGTTGSQATETLAAAGLTSSTGTGDVTMPVTAQDVAAGASVEKGTKVTLTLQEKPKLTLGQSNALRSAQQYLSFTAFSRSGLIRQLTSEYGEGYSAEDAEFAVASLEQTGKVDWNAEAAQAAKSYLDMTSFSRDGLFEQLTSEYGEGFTADQANAGLAAVGY